MPFPFLGGDGAAACVSAPYSGLKHYETRSYAPLVVPSLLVLVVATLSRFFAFWTMLKPLSVAAAYEQKLQKKFREAAWRSILYAIACGYAVKIMLLDEDLPWMSDSDLFWNGWPHHEVTPAMQSIYALYIGLYVHQLVFLFLDTKTSDFYALLVHHIITLSIVLSSWVVSFTRIGAFTMVLHDVSDVFLELAKCFNYCKAKYPRIANGADFFFLVFAISFFWLRLGVYPNRVVYSSMFEACRHVSCIDPPVLANCAPTMTFGIFIPLLFGLQALQVFWGWKVLGVVITVLRGKELEDPREE